MSTTVAETSLRQYWSMFNGTKKDFSEVEPQFDLTFHKQFTHIFQDGQILTREQTKQHHANHLAKGSTISIIHFKAVSPDYVDVQFSVKNVKSFVYSLLLKKTSFKRHSLKMWIPSCNNYYHVAWN